MRLLLAIGIAVLAAPAFAQEAPHVTIPETESGADYRNNEGVYDLLLRPEVLVGGNRIVVPRWPKACEDAATKRFGRCIEVFTGSPPIENYVRSLATPLPPPCELPPTANSPAAKPPEPAPCPAPR